MNGDGANQYIWSKQQKNSFELQHHLHLLSSML